jgi:diadenosine tetraphosphate (Ap4A) HIT family hydrolase
MPEQRMNADAADCRFCRARFSDRIVDEFETVWAIADRYPVSEGHHLIIPKRHTLDWFTMTDLERRDAASLIMILKHRLCESDQSITGFNIGVNCGASAGQTIFHAHIHLIPRRDGDTPNPAGGVRGVIPDKMSYRHES